MDKLIFSIIFLLGSTFCFAQTVEIPDFRFLSTLLISNCVDIDGDNVGDVPADFNNDGQIQVSEAESVIRLIVRDENISWLQGIQSFTNLEFLNCGDNPLTMIDLSQNSKLVSFWSSRTMLSQIDVSNNPDLEDLRVVTNSISSIDLTQNINLKRLNITGNNLSVLDISQNAALIDLECGGNYLTSLNLSANVNLERIWCTGNPLSYLDTSNNIMLKEIACAGTNITSFDFSENINLEQVMVFSNELTHIDVTNNPLLTFLDVVLNQISSIDLSQNHILRTIRISGNQFTSISFENNPLTEWIECNGNQIEEIDLSQLTNLRYIDAGFNNLQIANIKSGNNTSLEYLNVANNSNLRCIEVDDVNYANSHSNWFKDPGAFYSENCILGISDELDGPIISIYPIPVENSFFVNTRSDAKMIIEISSLTGATLFSQEIERDSPIDLTGFQSGIYIVSIRQDGHQFMQRIIKQ